MTIPSENPRRVGIGISGLDKILGGGLPPERMYLVEGDPGTGKTTLALQFLRAGKQLGESVLYVTLSETEAELGQVARSHGWSLDGVDVCDLSSVRDVTSETQYTLFHPSEVELEETTRIVLECIEKSNPRRVILDSLSELRLLARDPLRYRRQVLALKQYFAARGCTVLMLDDRTSAESDRQLESLAHGVVRLETIAPDYGAERRRVQILKLRSVYFAGGYHDYVIETGGIRVYPRLIASGRQTDFEHGSVTCGIESMDELLGGGMTRGSSTLILGPAGAGKSTLALAYASGEAARGGYSAVFTFDEGRASMISRADALGLGASKHIESGHLLVRQVDPAELTPGQFAHEVTGTVEHENARVVVIDSLNGYLTAMPNDRALAARLHELLAYLSQQGVASILVMAQHGLVGEKMTSPVDVSYVADTVLLLRYFEALGVVRKAVSVLKNRTGIHERTIREFRIDEGGLRVGQPLREFRGVLTGTPEYFGSGALLEDRDGNPE